MENEISMNKMGIKSIKSLLLIMGMPMVLSMALQALYNIVDSYFVSCMYSDTIANFGDYAVNALTLAFPIQMLMVAIGVGTGVGINALLSRSLGEGNRPKGNLITGNSIFLGLCTYVVFLIFGLFGVDAYMASQTNNQIVLEMGNSYLRICTILSFGITMYMIYEKLLQATGKTTLSTIAQVAGAAVNIILDPILIFGFWGCPQLGIAGAAYATVFGQCVSFILDAIFHYKLNKEIDSGLIYMKPQRAIIKEIYKIGIPAIIMQALMSFMTYGVNIIFGMVSSSAVTAYGVYYKIQQFVFFAAFGMNNAIIPIIAFNYGKQDKQRIQDGIKYGMLYTLVIMLVGAIVLQLFAHQICGIFAIASETQELCIKAIRIITIGYLFVGANIAYQGIFQALGYGVRSLVISVLRLIIIVLPLAWLFTKMPNASTLIWLAFPVAEAIAFLVAIVSMKKIRMNCLDLIVVKASNDNNLVNLNLELEQH